MKLKVIIPIIILLICTTAGLALFSVQTVNKLNRVNTAITGLSKDMASMRTLTTGIDADTGTSIAQLVTLVNPAVVRIDVTGSNFAGVGSGFIVDESGYVLTNQHVIDNSNSVKVTLASGESISATIVDFDANRDLALLKMTSNRNDFPTIGLGSAKDAAVGDAVVVVGFPLGLQLSGPASFSNGIVSALRIIDGLDYIQTNAAINAGNSGGPVIDMQGTLVGLTVASVTDPTKTVQGLGLVIPVADVLAFIDSGRISCSSCHYIA